MVDVFFQSELNMKQLVVSEALHGNSLVLTEVFVCPHLLALLLRCSAGAAVCDVDEEEG